jgi:hypothetical protein
MISCTDFIAAYSELFKFLESKGGKKDVIEYWEYLADVGLENLRKEALKNGLEGCFNYWSHTLNEEAADFTMILNAKKTEFKLDMCHCPSRGRLNELKHIEPYGDYCKHCDIVYRRVLEPLGFEFDIDLSNCKNAKCILSVKTKEKHEKYTDKKR